MRSIQDLRLSIFISITCALSISCGGANNGAVGSGSNSSSSGSTIDPYANCSPDTPSFWPCSISLEGSNSYYCDDNGTCSVLSESNSYAGWDSNTCNFDNASSLTYCSYVTPNKIFRCNSEGCGRYTRPSGEVNATNAHCKNRYSPYTPCTLVTTDGQTYGCDNSTCFLPVDGGF